MRGFGWFISTVILVWASVASCSDTNEFEESKKSSTRIVRRSGKHGRIIEKQNVVQIPLTATENNLKGAVKTVRYCNYRYEGNKKVLTDSGYNVYNKQGNLQEQYAWNNAGKPRWVCKYLYNGNKQLAGWILDMIARGEHDTTDFIYDANGLKIRAITKTGFPGTGGTKEYSYDVHGNEILVKQYNEAGTLRRMQQSTYDMHDNQIQIAELFPDGTVWSKKVATYDANYSLTSLSSYIQDSLAGKTVMKNNANGKHIEIAAVALDGNTRGKTLLSYNEYGHVKERIALDGDGKPVGKMPHIGFVYQYDVKGNVTLEQTNEINGSKHIPYAETVYEYIYFR